MDRSFFLSDRSFKVKVGNSHISDAFLVLSGVFQGSVLGPFLYIVYTADLK